METYQRNLVGCVEPAPRRHGPVFARLRARSGVVLGWMMIDLAQLLIPAIGTAAGWIFQSQSESRNQLFQIAMAKAKQDEESAEKAAKRGSGSLRWAIVGAILLAAVGSQFIFGWMNGISLEQAVEKGGWLWGLFPKRESWEVVPVQGFVILKEYRSAFELAVFFTLGRRAGR